MTLPHPRNAFSESKQTSQAALIDMGDMLLLSQFGPIQVFCYQGNVTYGLLNSIVTQSHNALGKVPRYHMQMRKSKADQTVDVCIISSSISKATVCLHQGVTTCGFRELVRYNLNRKCSSYDTIQSHFQRPSLP